MPGARSIALTAVGSRAKLKIASTSAVKTSAETNAVRLRNSSSTSLAAMAHATRSSSGTGRRLRVAPPVRGEVAVHRRARGEAPRDLDGHVRRELEPLVDVVRDQ